MKHRVTLHLTQEEFELLQAASLREGNGTSGKAIARRLSNVARAHISQLRKDDELVELVETVRRARRRAGLSVIEGGIR